MPQRLLYGSIAIGTVLCIVLFDAYLAGSVIGGRLGQIAESGTFIPAFFIVLVLGGGLEMVRLLRTAGLHPHARVGLVMSLLLLASPWLSASRLLGGSPSAVEGFEWQVVWLALTVVLTAVAQLRRGATPGALADVGATWLMVLYLGLMPSFAMRMRCSPDLPGQDGAWLVLIFLAVTKSSDIGAYFIGTAAGRHKLIPGVSPGKSWEGAVGGVLASMFMAVVLYKLYFIVSQFSKNETDETVGIELLTAGFRSLEVWQVLIFGALMSAAGQLGDLFESVFKRAAAQKDSASVLPGFGGMLDLIDSPIVAAPVAWFVLTVWWDV